MGWEAVLLVLVGAQAISVSVPHGAAAAGDGLPPSPAPATNGRLCDAVQCGRGKCKVNTNETFGFVCDCEPGWTKPQIGSYFQFLPCVIPNCTFNYTCFHSTAMSPAPSPPSNRSLFDPCNWSLCGGGTCVRTSAFGHRCDCNPGFGNLLNITDFPCFRPCALGFDCANLGILVATGSSLSPSPSLASPPTAHPRNTATTKFLGSWTWFSMLVAFLWLSCQGHYRF